MITKKIPNKRPVKAFVSKGSKEAYKINMAIINNSPKMKKINEKVSKYGDIKIGVRVS
jgi:hypothetical protein